MVSSIDVTSPANGDVLNKYQAAADIANRSLAFAMSLVAPGVTPFEICTKTDAHVEELAAKVYNKGKISKGVAFPCCVSVNNILAYYSPVDGEGEVALKEGDLVKIELGAHIDACPALVATSIIVGATKDKPATGPAADLVKAAHITAEAAVRLFRSGMESTDIEAKLKTLTNELGVKFMEGIVSHTVSKENLADDKVIIVNPAKHQDAMVDKCTTADYDVFVVDIALSLNGEGRVKLSEKHRTCIFKRGEDSHSLRLKTSRAVLTEIQSKFGRMAFNVRNLEGVNRARMALNECTQHQVVNPYDVLEEVAPEALTARIQFTTILMPAGPLQITNYQLPLESINSAVEVKSAEFKELLATPVRPPKKEKK